MLILRLCQIQWSVFWITSETSYSRRPQWSYVIRNTNVFWAALFSHTETDLYPSSGLSRYFTFYYFHILLLQNLFHSSVRSVLRVQEYGCSYSAYTSLPLMPHHVWGECMLSWHSNLLPHISEFSVYIQLKHLCLRSRDFSSPGANSEPAGGRQIPPSPVRVGTHL